VRAAGGWLVVSAAQVVWLLLTDGQRGLARARARVTVLFGLAHAIVMPQWRYRVHRWEGRAAAVYTRAGWLHQESRIAPISRIQTVDSERGPLEQLFGLADVTVTTASAAGPLSIEGLDRATAERLVDELTSAAQRRGATARDGGRSRRLAAARSPHAAHPSHSGDPARPPGAVRGLRRGQRRRPGPHLDRGRARHHARPALSRWFTTRYRVTEDRVEVGSGLFRRRVRAVSRDRIRTVDVTARAMHRLLGLAASTIGTGRSDREERGGVRLDGLTAPRPPRCARSCCTAARRRADAGRPVRRSRPPGGRRSPRSSSRASIRAGSAIAPFTLSGLVSVGVVLGFLANVANEAHFDPRAGAGAPPRRRLGHAPVALAARPRCSRSWRSWWPRPVGYALAFWDFRLTRHPGGTLHVTRGPHHHPRDDHRGAPLVGAEISEPLLLRMVAGARLIAIATGLRVGRGAERGGSLLVPPAPRAEVLRVAAEVIAAQEPVTCPLTAHGPRARARRHTRALAGWALLVAALAVVHWAIAGPWWLPVAALALLPVALLLAPIAIAASARRSGRALVAGRGSLIRRRSAGGRRGHHRLEPSSARSSSAARAWPPSRRPRPPASSTTRSGRRDGRGAAPRRGAAAGASPRRSRARGLRAARRASAGGARREQGRRRQARRSPAVAREVRLVGVARLGRGAREVRRPARTRPGPGSGRRRRTRWSVLGP
jgi:putative membrane protein